MNQVEYFNRYAAADHVETTKNIFSGEPLGIFESPDQYVNNDDSLKTWDSLEKHNLRLRSSMAPRNYFEKMAYWTEEGKVWHFPIDNEQGNRRNSSWN